MASTSGQSRPHLLEMLWVVQLDAAVGRSGAAPRPGRLALAETLTA